MTLPDRRPLLCLVTDRRRLFAAPGRFEESRVCLVEQARRAVEAGIDLIQIRERDLDAVDLAAVVAEIAALARGSATKVLVNDRVDIAVASGADGVHLRADSIPPEAARQLLPAWMLVGRSVHTRDEAVAAAPHVDFLIAGTVFPTPSKPAEARRLGVEGLSEIARAVPVPVIAIGGITVEAMPTLAAAGAAGAAAIGLFMAPRAPRDGRSCRAVDVRDVVSRSRALFDSRKAAS